MAIVTKTYIEKSNTLINGSKANTGLNPILELNYGNVITRSIIYFNHDKIKKLYEDKTYPSLNKLKHILHLKNSASLNAHKIQDKDYDDLNEYCKERATSFDLILFHIPQEWDNGRGFDYSPDLFEDSKRAYSEKASNWYNNTTNTEWENEGIFTNDFLQKQLELYDNGKYSIIINKIHFDYGNEDIECDITKAVNDFIIGRFKNNGIGIAFSPYIENIKTKKTQFVGFFSNNTNSFFVPYVETTYDDYISDDRNNFYLDKDNKLYFYSFLGGNLTNLDELPTCTVNGSTIASKQATKGVYYIDINLSSEEIEEDTMIYDNWSNLKLNGKKLNDVELYFTTVSQNNYYSFGLPSSKIEKIQIVPSIYGINHNEKIKRGDIRKINVECKIPYTSNQEYSIDNLYYRLYTKSGNDNIDVIKWTNIEKSFNNNFFYINTNELIPSKYYIDIKFNRNDEIINYYNILEFEILNNK